MPAAVLLCLVWFSVVLLVGSLAIYWAPTLGRSFAGNRTFQQWGTSRRGVHGQAGDVLTAVAVYLGGALVILAVFWPLGLLAHRLEDSVDWPALQWLAVRQIAGWSDLWWVVTDIGSPGNTQRATALGAVVFTVVWFIRRRPCWWAPLVTLPLAYALEKYCQTILQTIVDRGHPPTTLGTYPSGGCGRCIVIYGLIIFFTVRWLWPNSQRAYVTGWVLTAVIVTVQAYARLYNLEHWLTDVVGGIAFGVLLLLVMTTVFRILDREPSARR